MECSKQVNALMMMKYR